MKMIVKVDQSGFTRKLLNIQQGTPSATATALNRTAQYAQRQEEDETRRAFKSPTTFTQRAFYVGYANRSNLQSRVGVKNQTGGRLSPDHWLYAEVEGGERAQKAFERQLTTMGFLGSGDTAVPTHNAPLDGNGNVPGGLIRSMVAQLQQQGGNSPVSKRRRVSKKALYFGVPSGQRSGNLGPGIYQRTGRGIKQIMVFLKGPRQYSRRMDFYGVGQQAAKDRFPIEMRLAMKQTVDFK